MKKINLNNINYLFINVPSKSFDYEYNKNNNQISMTIQEDFDDYQFRNESIKLPNKYKIKDIIGNTIHLSESNKFNLIDYIKFIENNITIKRIYKDYTINKFIYDTSENTNSKCINNSFDSLIESLNFLPNNNILISQLLNKCPDCISDINGEYFNCQTCDNTGFINN